MIKNRGKGKRSEWVFHVMLVLPVILTIIFYYVPMGGIIIAFKEYKPGLGIFDSEWVGLKQFIYLLDMPEFYGALRNTLIIAIQKIILGIVLPVVFALLLNEVRLKWFKKTAQTMTFIPYFLSWVVLGGILVDFLSPNGGMLNAILSIFGIDPIYFLGEIKTFQGTIILSDMWKNMGYSSIVYLAALTGIDSSLYEASALDGAGRWKQTLHITLPSIASIIVLMAILSLGNVLNAGFDQVYNLYNPAVYETGDIIDTLVYRLGIDNRQYSLSTAVGLFKSVVSGALILVSYKLADKFAGYRVF